MKSHIPGLKVRSNNPINIGKSVDLTLAFHIPNNKLIFHVTVNGAPNHYHSKSVKLWYEGILQELFSTPASCPKSHGNLANRQITLIGPDHVLPIFAGPLTVSFPTIFTLHFSMRRKEWFHTCYSSVLAMTRENPSHCSGAMRIPARSAIWVSESQWWWASDMASSIS